MPDKCTSMEGPKKKWSEIVLEERDKGNVVCILLPGEFGTMPIKEIVKQPVDGLLWDLNRGEETALTFMDQKDMIHWVNNFAVALVIRELHGQVASLTEKVEQMKPYVRHKPTCSIYIKWSLGCDCGFNALLGE